MIIRNAKLEDADGIANVLVQSYNIDDIEEGKDTFKKEAKKEYNYIVAEDNGKVIGLTTWQMHGLPKHQLAELDRIAVLPEYRGKGVARLLFKKLLEEANKAYRDAGSKLRKLYLLTHASNARAQAFYKKLGFSHESTLKNHYYDGEDELVFSMFLDKTGGDGGKNGEIQES